MHSPFSVMDANTPWKLDMDRTERQLARKLKANTPSDAVIAQIRNERRGRNPLAVIGGGVATVWHAVTTRSQTSDAAPAAHR